MANVKITDLTAYTNPASTDVLPIVDVGADVTKKVSIADLLKNASAGTAAAPGIAFDGDNTGIYSPGADQVAISTGGTGRLFVDANGNVGLGTSSPQERLDVAGVGASFLRWEHDGTNGSYSAWTNGGILRLGPYYAATDRELALFVDNSNSAWITTGTTQVLNIGTNKTSRIYIDTVGRVGVGTTSPGANLDVVGKIRASTGILFGSDTADANALDDYEEGTWTPTGGTWSSAAGTYTKFGRVVVANGWASASGGQTLTLDEIGGLPFAYASGRAGNGSYMVYLGQGNPPTGLTIIPGAYGNTMNIGSTSLKFFPTFSRTNGGAAGGDRIQFTVVYQV